jgi:flagellar basal-body rod modification protein FlgD
MGYTISDTATYTPIDPSKTTKSGSSISDASSLGTNYSTFLNLLTAQVRNQDPLSPMDTTQWTNQLVQYSSVEQQLKGNQYLAQIAGNNSAGSMNAAVSYIGKTVTAATDTATLKDGAATWNYDLGAAAGSAKLSVLDSAGKVVWTGDAASAGLAKGTNSFTWDGKNSAGKAAAAGDYTLTVEAKTASGAKIVSSVSLSGAVSSAENIDGTIVLKVGNTRVPMSAVTKVS